MSGNRLNRSTRTALIFAFALGVSIGWIEPSFSQDSQSAKPLTAAIVRGADQYTTLQLLPAYQKYLGAPITRDAIESIARAIVKQYVADGFSQPEVQSDESQLAEGIVVLDVYEPCLTRIDIEGNAGPYVGALDTMRTQLLALKPLRTREFQTLLRRIRELPNLQTAITSNRDPDRRNGHILHLDVSFDALSANVRFTNRGTREVGREFLIGQAMLNGIGNRDLRAGLVFGLAADTDEFRGAGLLLDGPVAQDEIRATFLAFRSLSEPNESPNDFDVLYRHNRIFLSVADRWRNFRNVEYRLSGGLELEDLFILQSGVELEEDRERVLSLGGQLLWSGQSTQYLAVVGLREGLDAFGAGLQTMLVVEPGRSAGFTVLSVQLVRQAQIKPLWHWRIDAFAQYSNDVLSERERFKIGGDHLGRGFEVPAISGDSGLGAKIELRRELPTLRSRLGAVSTYASYDIGVAQLSSDDTHHSAATGAFGMALQAKAVSGSLELARPLTHADVDGNKRITVFAELSVNF